MKRRIAVIFASPSRYNSGMEIVDKAFEDFFLRNNLEDSFSYEKYRFTDISYNGNDNNNFKCLIKEWSRVIDSDIILYWGDFLQMKRYITRKARMLFERKVVTTYDEALNIVYNKLLLHGESDYVKSKAIAFGTNFLLDSTNDLINHEYNEMLKTFIQKSKGLYCRDVYSSNLVQSLRLDNANYQGVDCSLLKKETYKSIINNNHDNKNSLNEVGIYLGRSSFFILRTFLFIWVFVRKNVTSRKNVEWIQWLSNPKLSNKQFLVKKLYKFLVTRKHEEPNEYYCKNLNELKKFKFIVTDTYHLSVCAWALGIPCVLIGDIYRKKEMKTSTVGQGLIGETKDIFTF